jgi:hypothetical protein
MAKFKCIQTGEVYEFTAEHDIAGMRVHSEYEEVVEAEQVEEEKPKKKKLAVSGE